MCQKLSVIALQWVLPHPYRLIHRNWKAAEIRALVQCITNRHYHIVLMRPIVRKPRSFGMKSYSSRALRHWFETRKTSVWPGLKWYFSHPVSRMSHRSVPIEANICDPIGSSKHDNENPVWLFEQLASDLDEQGINSPKRGPRQNPYCRALRTGFAE